MLTEIFKAVLIMSVVGGLLAVFLLVMKPLTQRLFGAKWQFFVWLSVLIVLIFPIRIETKVQLPAPVARGVRAITVREKPYVSVVEDYSGVYMTEIQSTGQSEVCEWIEFAAVAWLAIAVILLLKTVICNVLLKRSLYKTSTYCKNFGKANIRESEAVGAPLLLGWVKPVLYVPSKVCDSDKMPYIMAHEGIHLKRNDIFIKWVVALVKSVHWFNPLVYTVARRIDEACEISCDAEATKSMDTIEKSRYMQVILDISMNEMNFRRTPAVGLSAKGKSLKKRFDAIKRSRKRSVLLYIPGAIAIITVTVGFVCIGGIVRGGAVQSEEPAQLFLIMPKNNHTEIESSAVEQGEISERDIEEVFESNPQPEVEEEVFVEETMAPAEVEEVAEPEALPKPVIQGEFNSTGGDTRQIHGIEAASDGCINVEIHSNAQETVDIYISDAESGRAVFSFSMPVPYEAAYCIDGLEPGRRYNVVLKGAMRNDWNIESEYIIY